MAEKNNSEKTSVVPATDAMAIVVSTATAADDSATQTLTSMPSAAGDYGSGIQSDSESVQIVEATRPVVVDVNYPAERSALGKSLEIFKLFLAPTLLVGAFVAGIALLGLAQRLDWIKPVSDSSEASATGMTSEETDTSWICPMMCVPPTNKPGRCPVCAMELVPAALGSSSGPSSTIQIDPRSRRVAGIRTTVATRQKLSREVHTVGEISYDETRLKTLAAYIDGRIEELYADYTGINVNKGDSLAMLYSPELYGAQVEYVQTLEFNERSESGNSRVHESNQRLLNSSRQRLVELGMTESQIKQLESDKTANRRLALHAPISGTVIEKLATTGQYVKAGMPIYRLADLSQVWLMLELFPEDAQAIQIGQSVTATTQSLGNEPFEGTVEFVEPMVDPMMRTVGVRVAVNNENGFLKPGEFARATLSVPLSTNNGVLQETVVIPRNSLLSIGSTSLAYVETTPGEFQLRHVKTGPTVDGMVAVLDGIQAGENVVSKSTFLLDAQMQLQGNPSLIDPNKAVMDESNDDQLTDAAKEEIRVAMEPLSQAERVLAEAQVICPVTEVQLGSMGMGTPIKLDIEGRTVFICCEHCRDSWVNDPEKYFRILDDYQADKSRSADDNNLPQIELPKEAE